MGSQVMPGLLESEVFRGAGFQHAFFTRHGGVSRGPFATLNFSISVGDEPQHVEENLRRAVLALGIEPNQMYFLSQVHGSRVHAVSGTEAPKRVVELRGDALTTATPGVACAVRSADCVPVLLADQRTGRVAAAHAGWRGVARGVVVAAVQDLLAHGCRVADLLAAIGPHISVAAFEVSDEVATELSARVPGIDAVVRKPGKKPHVDLRKLVRAQLTSLGVGDAAIDDVHGCTASDPDLFFSYRRDGAVSGRHLSAVVARGPDRAWRK